MLPAFRFELNILAKYTQNFDKLHEFSLGREGIVEYKQDLSSIQH